MKYKIAILGANSHVGTALAYEFNELGHELYLFARSPKKINKEVIKENTVIGTISDFYKHEYDAIINCIQPVVVKENFESLFLTLEHFDNLILDKVEKNENTLYIYMSSGAIYNEIDVDNIRDIDFYTINKLYIETKHRTQKDLNIVDIRLFSFFSRFVTLGTHYFLDQIINCIKSDKEFITPFEPFIRDYIHPKDLCKLLLLCIERRKLNTFFNAYSYEVVLKQELLDFFQNEYGLKYKFGIAENISNRTGSKIEYCSKNNNSYILGYIPEYTSMETIIEVTNFLIGVI